MTRKFAEWTAKWNDLMEFEAIPVITSAEAQDIMRNRGKADPVK